MTQINYLAVAVAVVGVFLISFGYYTALGAQYRDARGITVEEAAAAARPALWQFAVELLRNVVLAIVVAGLASRIGVDSIPGALILWLGLFVGFPLVLLAGSVMWDQVRWKLAVIHAGDWLLKLLVITLVVSLWR